MILQKKNKSKMQNIFSYIASFSKKKNDFENLPSTLHLAPVLTDLATNRYFLSSLYIVK